MNWIPPKLEKPDYVQETIQLIKNKNNTLDKLSDDNLEYLYHIWSEGRYSASWYHATPEALESFIEWATTPPYQFVVQELNKYAGK